MSLLLNLNSFHTVFSVSVVSFEHVIPDCVESKILRRPRLVKKVWSYSMNMENHLIHFLILFLKTTRKTFLFRFTLVSIQNFLNINITDN